jgi:hypothetical protein
MAEGNTERDELLKRELKSMTSEAFEQLTYELAHREDPEVKRLATPDGGADTVKPATDGDKALVWQAKHYPNQINWRKCEKSLGDSIKRWDPSAVKFVFPRDVSERVEASYQDKLKTPAKAKGVEVTAWTLSDLVRLLNQHTDLRSRFFGATQNTKLDALDRAIQAGGKLEDAPDLLQRAKTIAEFTEGTDPVFTYQTMTGGAETPAPQWDELPYMTMTVGDTHVRLHVAAWPREGAEVEDVGFSFNADEEGQKARRRAVQELAEGKEAVVREGARIRMHAPELFREGLEATGPTEARVSPGDTIPLLMEIHTPEDRLTVEVDLRPVPPPPGAAASFAGFAGQVLVEVNITLLEKPQMRAGISLTAVPSRSPKPSAEAAALLLAFDQQTHVVLASEDLFPESGELGGEFGGGGSLSEGKREWLQRLREFFDNLVVLEEHTGQAIQLPDDFPRQDILGAERAAEIVRNGGGTLTVGRMVLDVQDPAEVADLPERLARPDTVVGQGLSVTIFGQDLHLGRAELRPPKMKIVEVSPLGIDANSPARVALDVDDEADPEVEFWLV